MEDKQRVERSQEPISVRMDTTVEQAEGAKKALQICFQLRQKKYFAYATHMRIRIGRPP